MADYAQLEANCTIAGVANELTQFHRLVASLDKQTLNYTMNLIFTMSTQNPDKELMKGSFQQMHTTQKDKKLLLKFLLKLWVNLSSHLTGI